MEDEHRFSFKVPWTTIYVALIIPLLTTIYLSLPGTPQGSYAQMISHSFVLFLTSPFNISYEMANNGVIYNYVLVVAIYLLVEIYSRNIADLKGGVSLIRNAAILSIVASYIVSALVWYLYGFPSSGTSILAFNMLLFSAFETYDSELIKRMSERTMNTRKALEIMSIVFVVLVVILSLLLYIYLNGNEFWYVHIIGGVIFAPIYYVYLSKTVRPKVDELEDEIEKDVEKDLEEVGIEMEEEEVKLERDVGKDLEDTGIKIEEETERIGKKIKKPRQEQKLQK